MSLNQGNQIKELIVTLGFLGLGVVAVSLGMRAVKAEGALEQSKAEVRILLQKVQELDQTYAKIRDYAGTAQVLSRPADAHLEKHHDPFMRERTMNDPWTSFASRIDVLETHRSDADRFLYHVDQVDAVKDHAEMLARRLASLADILKANKSLMNAIPSLVPVEGNVNVTSEFGVRLSPFEGKRHMHAGLDIAAEIGTKIIAPADATVSFVGEFDDMGRTVVLDHGNGILTRFGHTHAASVRQGQKVKRGHHIATVGISGRSTGPHLHYEVWVGNNPVNPREFFFDLSDGPILNQDARVRHRERLPMPQVKVANLRREMDL